MICRKLSWALLLLGFTQPGGELPKPALASNIEEKAARATVLALRASVSQAAIKENVVLLLPSGVPLELEDAVSVLSRLPKPVVCIGFPVAGAIAIGCWDTTTTDAPQPEDPTRDAKEWYTQLEQKLRTLHDSDRILLLGHGESIILSVDELYQWQQKYKLRFISYRIDYDDPAARRARVGAAMRFSRAGAALEDSTGIGSD